MNKPTQNFIARHEDFVCVHCGKLNKTLPSGTRNHCQFCLWSCHVDKDFAGDRASECKGAMEPLSTEKNKKGEWVIVQKCTKCGKIWRNHLAPDDDFEVFLKVAEDYAKNPK